MEPRVLQLWCAYADDLRTAAAWQRCAEALRNSELDRRQTAGSREQYREARISRFLTRYALSHFHPFPPGAWQFAADRSGKPRTQPDCGLRFHTSSTESMAACLIADGAEVGVDLEARTGSEHLSHLVRELLSPVEQAQWIALDSELRGDRALSLWTLKRAYIKARGMGRELPWKRVSFLFGGLAGIRMELDPALGDEAENWQFCLLDHAGHRLALMVEATARWRLEIRELRLPEEQPAEIRAGVLGWFPWVSGGFFGDKEKPGEATRANSESR